MAEFGVVVVNWNGAAHTTLCLDSLAAARPSPGLVVVVDNGSTDRSADAVLAWIRDHKEPLVLLEYAHRNLGFAGGNNLGLNRLRLLEKVTHFLVLNNDATARRDYFAAMTEALAQRPGAALLGATILEGEGERRVWYAGGVVEPWLARARHLTTLPSDERPRPTGFVTGCALMISRPAFEVLGPLAECYFPLYMEDVEYSYRARAAGLDVCYVPGAVVRHRIGGTVGRYEQRPSVALWHTRHQGYFVRRNLRGARKIAALSLFVLVKIREIGGALVRLQPGRAWALLRGVAEGLASPAAHAATFAR